MKLDILEFLPGLFERFTDDEVESTAPKRFAGIVEKYGDRLAIKASANEVTYGVLASRASAIAHRIQHHFGVVSEPVALLFRHGSECCISQFGVLCSGKFFVSLDYDLDRLSLAKLLSNLSPRLVLSSSEFVDLAISLAEDLPDCTVWTLGEGLSDESYESALASDLSPDSLAYVVYTSGSTGPAEGVAVTHRSLLHMIKTQTITGHLGSGDRGLALCHISGAASVSETFSMLLNGGTLFPFDLKTHGVATLVDLIRREKITVCTFVPVVFRLVVESLEESESLNDVRLVRLSGDRVLRRDCVAFRRHFSPNCILRVSLGASEAMIYTQLNILPSCIPSDEIVPAGYVLPDMQVQIVDDQRKPLEVGQIGEIAVSSRYLAVGYWNNERLTRERFSLSDELSGVNTYFTRDLGYFEQDGCLVHIGRTDSRVKIHGKFVSLTDIERFLLSMREVAEAAVVESFDSYLDDRILVAYYVVERGCSLLADDVRGALSQNFSREDVPKKILQIESLPTTKSHKVDRRFLAAKVLDFSYVALSKA